MREVLFVCACFSMSLTVTGLKVQGNKVSHQLP